MASSSIPPVRACALALCLFFFSWAFLYSCSWKSVLILNLSCSAMKSSMS